MRDIPLAVQETRRHVLHHLRHPLQCNRNENYHISVGVTKRTLTLLMTRMKYLLNYYQSQTPFGLKL